MIFWAEESLDCYLRMGNPPHQATRAQRQAALDARCMLPLLEPVGLAEQRRALERAGERDNSVIRILHEHGIFREPYTVMVTSRGQRHRNARFAFEMLSINLPPSSLVRLGPNAYILSPPLCIAMLARDRNVGDVELVFDVSELCGCYAYGNVPTLHRQIVEREPLSRVADFRGFYAQMKEANQRAPRGVSRVERLLPYAIERARSPREVELGIDLGYPASKGGIGAPPFEVNKEIALSEQEQWVLGRHGLEADFMWEKQGLIVEYDGEVHERTRDADSARLNVLRGKGYSVEVLTGGLLDAGIAFETFASRLEAPLGIRLAHDAESRAKRQLLQQETARLARRNGHVIPPEENGIV